MTAVEREPRSESRGTSVIVNVLDVLRCFTVEQPAIGVTQIADQVGLHKSSVSRILATLEQERVVEREEGTRRYRLGPGLIAIAGPLLAHLDVRQVAYPLLEELREATGETAVLNIWDGGESVSVEQLPSHRLVKHTSVMGSRYRTGLSATVQMFLAHRLTEAATLLAEGRIELPEEMPTTEYLDRLSVVYQRGVAVNYGQTSPDEVGVAAPVFNHRGEVAACVMVAAPFYRITPEILDELCAQTERTARRVSNRLGYQQEG